MSYIQFCSATVLRHYFRVFKRRSVILCSVMGYLYAFAVENVP